jgi:ABC-type transporter Mla subunit MlaD
MATNNHAKLGMFLVLSMVACAGFAVFFLQQLRDRPSLLGVTYFNEAIGGLRVDSPVRYRGVDIGRVQAVALDHGTTYIRVEFEVWTDVLPEWESKALQQNVKDIDPLLRAQISTVGLIGQSFLQVDRLETPPPPLVIESVPEGRHYLPSRASDMTSLVRNMRSSLQRMPAILDRLDQTLESVQLQVEGVQVQEVAQRINATLDVGQSTLHRINKAIDHYSALGGPVDVFLVAGSKFLDTTNRKLSDGGSIDRALVRIDTLGGQVESSLADDAVLMQLAGDVHRLLIPGGEFDQILRQVAQVLQTIDGKAREVDTAALAVSVQGMVDQMAMLGSDMRTLLPALQSSLTQLRQFLRGFEEEPEQLIFGPREVAEE